MIIPSDIHDGDLVGFLLWIANEHGDLLRSQKRRAGFDDWVGIPPPKERCSGNGDSLHRNGFDGINLVRACILPVRRGKNRAHYKDNSPTHSLTSKSAGRSGRLEVPDSAPQQTSAEFSPCQYTFKSLLRSTNRASTKRGYSQTKENGSF